MKKNVRMENWQVLFVQKYPASSLYNKIQKKCIKYSNAKKTGNYI